MATTFIKGRNRAWAQLSAPINGSVVNIPLTAGQGARLTQVLTASGNKVRAQIIERDVTGAVIACELVDITNNVSDVLIVTRGVEATRATDSTNTYSAAGKTFTAAAYIEEVVSQGVLQEIEDAVNAVENGKLALSGGAMTGPILQKQSANIASATTTDLSTMTWDSGHITGTVTIVALGTAQAGTTKNVTFDGILTLTHNNTTLILPAAGLNMITAVGDTATFVSEGSGNWRCTDYNKVSGRAINEVTVATDSIIGLSSNLSDGSYTLDGTQAAVGGLFSKASNVYTLLRDAYFNVLTITSPASLVTNGYRIYANTVTGTGSIKNNGGAGGAGAIAGTGTGGTAGAATPAGTLPASTAGKAGTAGPVGASTGGTAGTSVNPSMGVSGVAGGNSGNGNAGAGTQTGGAAGTATTETVQIRHNTFVSALLSNGAELAVLNGLMAYGTSSFYTCSSSAGSGSGSGGGGSGGSTGGGGGGSGASGGPVHIFAKTISGTLTITSTGGAGGAGGNGIGTTNGAGGGWGGGSGGVIVLVYTSLAGGVTVTAAGGTGGAAGTLGQGSPTAGANGLSGTIYKMKVTL